VQVLDEKDNVKQTIVAEEGKVVVTVKEKVESIENATILLKDTMKKSSPLGMVNVIQIFMLLAGALIVIFTKMDASEQRI